MIYRPMYVDRIMKYTDTPFVKMLTGVTRCGKSTILKTQEKFYLADTALRYSVLGYRSTSVVAVLENVVYLELCRRGYSVNIGKTMNGEIDFIAER